MNAVEIEEALSQLASDDFDGLEFPYAFLAAFGAKETTLKRLRKGETNASDLPGGLLWRNNIHIAVCEPGTVAETIQALRASPKTAQGKAKFILATDGEWFEAEDLVSGEHLPCLFKQFADHFGFFLPLAGISTVKELKDNPVDVRATGRLNKLYVELLGNNPEWAKADRRHDMNHFMARLVFCYFAEDTDIFQGDSLFTRTIDQMTQSDGSNVHEVLEAIFQAMNLAREARLESKVPSWADRFPYVNGGLFSGGTDVPRFTRAARSFLIRAGELDWKEINPDIFGSMIQAVADDEERGALGMHYTSVPNILKVLNPLFLDDLRSQLESAGDNKAKLLNLRKRMSKIRVFDPACGSGNFLVIAYKQMREIEAEINRRREERQLRSEIPLTNFRGVELRDFPAEIARLALIIAEFQSDVLYRGQQEALAEVLPLDSENWITSGNALRLNWLDLFPSTGTGVRISVDDLFAGPDQAEVSFTNEGGETYICGNPPYKGSKWQSKEQKADLAAAWVRHPGLAKTTDYVAGWFAKFLNYVEHVPNAVCAFVATNSVCQGQQATEIWPAAFSRGCEIRFAHTSFKWSNLASNNAGVTVVIVGLARSGGTKLLFQDDTVRECSVIGPYLVADSVSYVEKALNPLGPQAPMLFGNMPRDGGNLFVNNEIAERLINAGGPECRFIKRFAGSEELINGRLRYCLWIEDSDADEAAKLAFIRQRLELVAENRRRSTAESTRVFAKKPHRFVQIAGSARQHAIVIPRVSSENRPYLPVDLLSAEYVVGDRNFALYDAPLWNFSLIASRLHWVWIGAVCVRLEMRFSYSNTLGWNTFPVPRLTDTDRAELTRCAEDILLAREAHYPATLAELYDADRMPEDLRRAHTRNDEVLERIYIGRRFRNDSERLEKLFEFYNKMAADKSKSNKKARKVQ